MDGKDRYEVEYDSQRGREALKTKLRQLGVQDISRGSNAESLSFPKQTSRKENVLDLLGLPRPPDE